MCEAALAAISFTYTGILLCPLLIIAVLLKLRRIVCKVSCKTLVNLEM